MDPIHVQALKKNRKNCVDNLEVVDLLPVLAEHDVFTDNMIERIKNEGARSSQAQKLMSDLPRRGRHAYESFLRCLEETKQGFLADDIRQKEAQIRDDLAAKQSREAVLNRCSDQRMPRKFEPMDIGGQRTIIAHPTDDVRSSLDGTSIVFSTPQSVNTLVMPERASDRLTFSFSSEENDTSQVYKMDSRPRGYCLIINNRLFSGFLKERQGTDIDRDNLSYLFKQLGYLVDEKNNLTANAMKHILYEFSRLSEHRSVDSCVVILLTHGLEGQVYGTDCTLLSLSEIFSMFDGQHCLALKGKPKFFIVQACRGERQDSGFEVHDGPGEVSWEKAIDYLKTPVKDETDGPRLPSGADFLISYATIPGYVSWRNSAQGSWFIQALVEVFISQAPKEDVVSMLVAVNDRVATLFESGSKCKQIPAPVVLLRKKWFFFPSV